MGAGGGYPPLSIQEGDIKVKAGQVRSQPWQGVETLPAKESAGALSLARRPKWLQLGRVGSEGLDRQESDPGQTCRTQEGAGLDGNTGTLQCSFNLEVVFTFRVASWQRSAGELTVLLVTEL